MNVHKRFGAAPGCVCRASTAPGGAWPKTKRDFFDFIRVFLKQVYFVRLFRYKFETLKLTENFIFGFKKQSEKHKKKQIEFRFVLV